MNPMKQIQLIAVALLSSIVTLAAYTKPTAVLVVVTNFKALSDNEETGFWMSEVSHAWTAFTDAGFDVDFASPQGGLAPIDPRSFDLEDEENKRLWHDLNTVNALFQTQPLSEINPEKYSAIYFAGGHGTMWDFPDNEDISRISAAIWENGGVVSAVCHGPAALIGIKLSSGENLVAGKSLTSFSNEEEEAVGLTEAVPFALESRLESLDARLVVESNFTENVVVDDRLITGQNPQSAKAVAEAIVHAIKN